MIRSLYTTLLLLCIAACMSRCGLYFRSTSQRTAERYDNGQTKTKTHRLVKEQRLMRLKMCSDGVGRKVRTTSRNYSEQGKLRSQLSTTGYSWFSIQYERIDYKAYDADGKLIRKARYRKDLGKLVSYEGDHKKELIVLQADSLMMLIHNHTNH